MREYITNKKEVANIAANLVLYKVAQTINGVCATKTPMRDCYDDCVTDGFEDTPENKEKFLRVARYLCWNVKKYRNGNVYENGILIWLDINGL